jgi:DUF4097 and DUF4098 domain-containing protein YvlB
MKRIHRLLSAAVVVASVAGPRPAAAQVYPERIATKHKARAIATVSAYQRRDREQETERTTKTFRLGPSGSLTLVNVSGDIAVTRAAGSDTSVEIVKTAHGRNAAEAREMLQLVTVDTTERSGRAEVKVRYPDADEAKRRNRRGVNVSVAYIVTAPAGTRISAESISGSISVVDLKADVNATTVSGDVRLSGTHGGSGKTISGSVEITDAQVDGALESSSVSGDVILRRVTARSVETRSVSGDIRLDDIRSERVTAHSTSAGISFSGWLAKNGRYELKGFSGDVRVALAGDTGFEIDASSYSGDISAPGFQFTPRGRVGGRSMNGTFGDGSAMLDVSTFSGSIIISKR